MAVFKTILLVIFKINLLLIEVNKYFPVFFKQNSRCGYLEQYFFDRDTRNYRGVFSNEEQQIISLVQMASARKTAKSVVNSRFPFWNHSSKQATHVSSTIAVVGESL